MSKVRWLLKKILQKQDIERQYSTDIIHSFGSIGASSRKGLKASISFTIRSAMVLLFAANTLLDMRSNGPPETKGSKSLLFIDGVRRVTFKI